MKNNDRIYFEVQANDSFLNKRLSKQFPEQYAQRTTENLEKFNKMTCLTIDNQVYEMYWLIEMNRFYIYYVFWSLS